MGLRMRKKKPPMRKVVFLETSSFYVVTISCSHILLGHWLIISVVTEKMLKEGGPGFIIAVLILS